MQAKVGFLFLVLAGGVLAQAPRSSESELLQAILLRMDALEKQNRQMAEEIHHLRQENEDFAKLVGQAFSLPEHKPQPISQAPSSNQSQPPLDERVAVNENRIEEQAQTKVEASQKLPVSLTGRILFNAFANTGDLRALPDAVYSPFINTTNSIGATMRQTMLGFDLRGPSLPGDGKVNAHIMLDFYSVSSSEQTDWIRLRDSDISLDWARRSFTVAFDKPLISPRQPDSLAEVSIPPLADAGNLWLWVPQVRYEERFKIGDNAGIKAQAALLQTDETYNYVPAAYSATVEKSRPAGEARVEFWKTWSEGQRLEVAGGVHAGTSHIAGTSTASRIYSVDWFATPFSKLEISGTYFRGQNFSSLGALSPGVQFLSAGIVAPVHGEGGWTQFSVPVTSRIKINLFSGLQNNRSVNVDTGDVLQNLTYAGNVMFHLSQNVILSTEALQMRSRLKPSGDMIRNRYDLALAYLF